MGDYVWLDIQDGTGKDKLGGHTEGPFLALARATPTYVIHREDLFERGNSDRDGWARAPTTTEALPENYGRFEGDSRASGQKESQQHQRWPVKGSDGL